MNLEVLNLEKLGVVFVMWIALAVIIEEAAGVLFNWKHVQGQIFRERVQDSDCLYSFGFDLRLFQH